MAGGEHRPSTQEEMVKDWPLLSLRDWRMRAWWLPATVAAAAWMLYPGLVAGDWPFALAGAAAFGAVMGAVCYLRHRKAIREEWSALSRAPRA
jgi:hypothetical protein